jgi:hypothetical protein
LPEDWKKQALQDPGGSLLDFDQLREMAAAARTMNACEDELTAMGTNIVSAILPSESELFEWRHYPDGDFHDSTTGCQFFYHVHPKLEDWEEHGHFHLFAKDVDGSENTERLVHLIAISMDVRCRPIRLFTTNRWVTSEAWRDADTVIELLSEFSVEGMDAGGLVAEWLTSLSKLFAVQISALITARDLEIDRRRQTSSDLEAVLEDRGLESISHMEIDLAAHRGAILNAETALGN